MAASAGSHTRNHRFILARRPDTLTGPVRNDVLRYEVTDIPDLGAGRFLVRNEWMSLAPATRG
jgi:NADPH-dependent curcumin reductase CurA